MLFLSGCFIAEVLTTLSLGLFERLYDWMQCVHTFQQYNHMACVINVEMLSYPHASALLMSLCSHMCVSVILVFVCLTSDRVLTFLHPALRSCPVSKRPRHVPSVSWWRNMWVTEMGYGIWPSPGFSRWFWARHQPVYHNYTYLFIHLFIVFFDSDKTKIQIK